MSEPVEKLPEADDSDLESMEPEVEPEDDAGEPEVETEEEAEESADEAEAEVEEPAAEDKPKEEPLPSELDLLRLQLEQEP